MDRLPKNFLKENLRRPRLSEKESEPVSSAVSGAIERLVVVVAGPGIQEPESQWDRRLIGTVPALRTDREVMVNPAGVCSSARRERTVPGFAHLGVYPCCILKREPFSEKGSEEAVAESGLRRAGTNEPKRIVEIGTATKGGSRVSGVGVRSIKDGAP